MDTSNLKNKLAYKFIKNQIKKTDKSGNLNKFKPKKIEHVGILADLNLFNTYDFTDKLAEGLGLEHKDLKVMLFRNTKEEDKAKTYDIISHKDFGFYGNIKGESLRSFVDTEFDILINYCHVDHILSQVASFRSSAALKVSFKNEEFDFYNILLDIEENKIDTFNNELTKYLKILNFIE